jgi:hypothetical protein
MELKYNIPKYVAMSRMSSKVRILVEGKDDRGHVQNLLHQLYPKVRLKVDSAVEIIGDCAITKNNNRAKIEKIHGQCKVGVHHRKLFFLCDREFRNFDFGSIVADRLNSHESDGNLSWTLGHSIENYFLSPSMLGEGFRYLSTSGHKTFAVTLFCDVLPDAIKKIAALTLAAKELSCANYPASQISWQDIRVNESTIEFDRKTHLDKFCMRFWDAFDEFLSVAEMSGDEVCSRLCRGHTAVLVLQRLFAACLYKTGASTDDDVARYDANLFNNVGEVNISSALSEAWIRQVSNGVADYPIPLVESIHALSA